MKEARWNIYLVKRGEPPFLYFKEMKEPWTLKRVLDASSKAFDGSDADGFVMIRSDFPVPDIWPEESDHEQELQGIRSLKGRM